MMMGSAEWSWTGAPTGWTERAVVVRCLVALRAGVVWVSPEVVRG